MTDREIPVGVEFENIVAEAFRKAGWRIRRRLTVGEMQADLIVADGKKKYIVEVKSASEGRSDRLIPLLSQAILQARSLQRQFAERATALAVVAARRVPPSVADNIERFAKRHAPDVAIGIVDAEGFRRFIGPGLQGLDAQSSAPARLRMMGSIHQPDLFSDLNQWMLKILLGQRLPASFISVPRQPIRNASHLAEAANVSIMSASRLVNQLATRGFLNEGGLHLQLIRVEELLELWTSSNRQAAKEVPAHWIIKGRKDQAETVLRQYASRQTHNQPRCCLGFFAAADALGLGFVRGAPAYIYLERLTFDALNRLGLAIGESARPPDLTVRMPRYPETVFRARVFPGGVPVSDVLQVWLDVLAHPARGKEQAREIRRTVLAPLFAKSQ